MCYYDVMLTWVLNFVKVWPVGASFLILKIFCWQETKGACRIIVYCWNIFAMTLLSSCRWCDTEGGAVRRGAGVRVPGEPLCSLSEENTHTNTLLRVRHGEWDFNKANSKWIFIHSFKWTLIFNITINMKEFLLYSILCYFDFQ